MPRWPKRKPRPGVDEYGRTPLWYHALEGQLAAVRKAIAGGADPNQGDDVNYTPLHAAVQSGHVAVVEFLLASGSDPNKVDNHGNGPLLTALLKSPNEIRAQLITILLRAGANPHHANRYGVSAIDVARDSSDRGLEPLFNDTNGNAP